MEHRRLTRRRQTHQLPRQCQTLNSRDGPAGRGPAGSGDDDVRRDPNLERPTYVATSPAGMGPVVRSPSSEWVPPPVHAGRAMWRQSCRPAMYDESDGPARRMPSTGQERFPVLRDRRQTRTQANRGGKVLCAFGHARPSGAFRTGSSLTQTMSLNVDHPYPSPGLCVGQARVCWCGRDRARRCGNMFGCPT